MRGAGRSAKLALVLALALLLAWFASATPRVLLPDAPPERASAGRAMADIALLAAVPHPVGSPQDAQVRDLLVKRLRELGLQPQVIHRSGVQAWGERSPRTWTVDDVVARVPGVDPAAPALLVMSHYDSVPRSPGAADDMASVASALEMARLLTLHPPAREVVFAFTDGEEAGLLGAQALLGDPGFVRRIGFVVNMDVRGGGGRALMFQTGPNEAGAERLYAAQADRPAGDSLAAFLYAKTPNDTDFSVALARGLPGLNYAFIGRPALYHTPAATPSAVEAGAVQSLLDQAWAVAAPLAHAAALPPPGDDLTWFDLLGRKVVIYPASWGWAVVVATALLLALAVAREGAAALPDVAFGAARSLGATVGAAALLWLYGRLTVHGYYQAMAQAPLTEAATAVAALAAGLVALGVGPGARSPLGRWTGAAALAWAMAVLLQFAAPQTAFLAEWPALLAALALALSSLRPGVPAHLLTVACAIVGLGFLLEVWHLVVLGVGLVMPAVGAALLPLALAVLAPLMTKVAPPPLAGPRLSGA